VAALTRERILRTAVAMADREGFDAVTLRRIATELGVHVTSLYNHVPTREAVTDGIVELLIDEAGLPAAPVEWEDWVRRFFRAIERLAVAHPGAFTALQRRPVQGERAAASFEAALAAFAEAGFDAEGAYNAVKATALTALGVGLERSLAVGGTTAETAVDELSPDRFPHVRLLDRLTDPEPVWAFSLETLVEGLRAQLEARRAAAGSGVAAGA
jgi:AcrR family transcriptional regulator